MLGIVGHCGRAASLFYNRAVVADNQLRYRFFIPAAKGYVLAGIQIIPHDDETMELAIQIEPAVKQEIVVRLKRCPVQGCGIVIRENQKFCSPEHRTAWHNKQRQKT